MIGTTTIPSLRVWIPPLLIRILPALLPAACSDPPARPDHAIRFDFEQSGWGDPMQRTDTLAHGGRYSASLRAPGVIRVTGFGPLIPMEGADDLELEFWSRVEQLESGSLTYQLALFADDDPVHPAVPNMPRRVGHRTLARFDGPDPAWKHHSTLASELFPPHLLELAVAVRLELSWNSSHVPVGLAYIDDVMFRLRSSD